MKPTLYEKSGGWGDAIYFLDWDRRVVTGHKGRIPMVGDYFSSPMQSGNVGYFRFTEVRPCYDPPDQFFATVEDVGYERPKELDEEPQPRTREGIFAAMRSRIQGLLK